MIKFAVFFVLFVKATHQEGCNIAQFRTWDPVVLSSETFEFLYPSIENPPDNRNITLPVDATIIISCNGGRFSPNYTTTKTILATCNQDSQLEVQDTVVNFDQINCINFEPLIAKVTSTPCGPNAIIIDVGFQVGLNIKFVPQIKFCFDTKNLISLYANYNLTKSIGFIKSYLQTQYVVDTVYNINVNFDTLYQNTTYQQESINKLLGLPANSTKYVDPITCSPNLGVLTPGFCFSRRHLTYRGALVYISQQYGTYRYINVAPQWYFLDYNLDKLEYNVIDYVKSIKMDLEVYTGTFGVATLPHDITEEEVELFLYINGNQKAFPVPLIFWKLLYNAITEKATVFLTVNDPYQRNVNQNIICNDISDEIPWLTWEKHNVTKGYSYACSYEDAKKTISYLPEIVTKGILV